MKIIYTLILLLILCSSSLYSQTQQELDSLFYVDSSWIVKPDSLNYNYDLPLLFAADSGNAERVIELISKGANVNVKTIDGNTALMYAAQQGHLKVVKILLLNGAEIDAIPENEMTAFLAAVAFNHFYVAEYLIKNGANINHRDSKYNGALHYSVAYGYYYMTELLLFYKANIEILDYNDKTPLFTAVKYNDIVLTDLLLTYGANADTSEEKGFTPIMIAAEKGYDTIVNMLLDAGANINKVNDCNMSSLSYAVKHGNTSTVNLLLKRGAKADHNINPATSNYTLAFKYEHDTIKALLKDYGAKRNFRLGIDKVLVGFKYFNGNTTDYMCGFSLGIRETKTKVELSAGIDFRPAVRGVLAEIDGVTYQMWEKRSSVNLGLDRQILMSKSTYGYSIGLFAGTHIVYTYGKYRGSDTKAVNGFKLMPQAGLVCNSLYSTTKIYYSYLDIDVYDISPHRINCSLIFKINLDNVKKYSKTECKRNERWEL